MVAILDEYSSLFCSGVSEEERSFQHWRRQDESRNRIMRMSLVMEMGMLGVGVGGVLAGIFGNLMLFINFGNLYNVLIIFSE
jgi:hypothetical protein